MSSRRPPRAGMPPGSFHRDESPQIRRGLLQHRVSNQPNPTMRSCEELCRDYSDLLTHENIGLSEVNQ